MFINQNKNSDQVYFMRLALQQAQKVLGNTKENPAVGCVITKNNHVIQAAHTSIDGRPHAEQNALSYSQKKLYNCQIYITLEPCSHFGKTAACTDIIIKKKIKKVFFSILDPDVRSFNKSSKIFNKFKISVNKGLLKKEIAKFYKSYINYKKEGLPYVTSKIAITKDFYTKNKHKKWITNKFSRGRVHLLRSIHDCVMTSSNTVIEDNPRLTCRIKGIKNRSPNKIILDNKLKIGINSNVIKDSKFNQTIIFYNKINKKKIKLLKRLNIKLYRIPLDDRGCINLTKALTKAKELGFSRIFLETGIKLNTSFLKEKLINNFKIFISNKKAGLKGVKSFKNSFKTFLKSKQYQIEQVNLLGDKLISYELK